MEVRHEPADGSELADPAGRVLATDVEFAEGIRQQAKGLMFRGDVPADYALVFEFDDPPRFVPDALAGRRSIHMLFVTVPLDVLWLHDDRVEQVSTLSPWTGLGFARADTVIEMRGGAAEGVAVGDTVRIVEDD